MRIEAAAWAVSPHRVVKLTAAAMPDALAVLQTDGGAYDLTAVQDRLSRRLGSPAAIPVEINPIVVATPTDVRIAERRLLAGLVKDTDGFMARHVERPLSLQVSRYLAPTAVTPNQISMVSIVVGLSGAPFFLSVFSTWQTVGALLLLAHSILDGCDGELARLKFQESRWGGVLDFWGDNIVHMAAFTCMAAGWALSLDAAWPLLLGATAVLGNLSSATFVYWRLMRDKNDSGPLFTSVTTAPDRRLARLLDAASRRDFIYLVLVLALFGKSNWFLLLASFGAPMFFFFLVFLAMRERVRIYRRHQRLRRMATSAVRSAGRWARSINERTSPLSVALPPPLQSGVFNHPDKPIGMFDLRIEMADTTTRVPESDLTITRSSTTLMSYRALDLDMIERRRRPRSGRCAG